MHKEYTFDLLSRDLWPQLPWQPHILIILDISVIPERFHVNSMFSYGVIAKKRFSLNLTSDLWPLTFGSESLRDTRAHPRAPSHQVWRKSAQPFRRSFWHKKGQTHTQTHTHTHLHTHPPTHTHTHTHTDTFWPLPQRWTSGHPWVPHHGLSPESRYSGTPIVTMATVAMVTEKAVNSPTGKGTTISHPPKGEMR